MRVIKLDIHGSVHQDIIYENIWVPTLPWNRPVTTHMYNTRGFKYSLDASEDERKYRSKHAEQRRNNKLSYTFASCWSFSYIFRRM